MIIKAGLWTVLIILLALAAAGLSPALAKQTIVPREERISEHDALIMLVELLLAGWNRDHLSRAGEVLDRVQESYPQSPQAELNRIRLEAALGNVSRVEALVRDFIETRDFNVSQFLEAADISASAGRYELCRDIYLMTLDELEGAEEERIRMVFAERQLLWGDFYSGEIIIRRALSEKEQDPELNLKLARNLIAQQRFEEARKHLQTAIRQDRGKDRKAYFQSWMELVNTGLLQKDFARAAQDTDDFLARHGEKEMILLPGARAYLQSERLKDAVRLYHQALKHRGLTQQALLGLAGTELKRDDPQKAEQYLREAVAHDVRQPEAEVMLAWIEEKSMQHYVQELVEDRVETEILNRAASALAGRGEFASSVNAYRAALEQDPGNFEARTGLAEVYGSMGRHSQSLQILEKMLQTFPESYKLQLTRARVSAWARAFSESLEAYGELYTENPDNQVVLREAARTAYWGKKADLGDDYYQMIHTPTVDEKLLERLQDMDLLLDRELPGQPLVYLRQKVDSGSIYSGYEAFFQWYREYQRELSQVVRKEIQDLRHSLEHIYLVQKSAVLEREAKRLAWNERFAPARRRLQELVEHEPGNQEALFDLAQACCVLGLGDREKAVYRAILEIDPLHGQASRALEMRKRRSSPGLFGTYSFWREKGRGELARIDRHRLDAGLEVPIKSRHSLRVTGHRYLESPLEYADSVQASGISLQGQLVTGPHVSFSGILTYKTYDEEIKTRGTKMQKEEIDLDDLFLGQLNMHINLDNYAGVILGYEKREKAANAMALAQGIYSQRYRIGLEVNPVRRLDAGLQARYLDYSDGNDGYVYAAEVGFAFTDHPRLFRAILSGEYRDTSADYQGCPAEQGCSVNKDFKHPYWTPQDYWGSAVTFEFTHDLAEDFFCGAREHFYQLELTLGTEKGGNDSIEVRGAWNREFENGLGINTRAMWHDSREWNAASLELGLFYRF